MNDSRIFSADIVDRKSNKEIGHQSRALELLEEAIHAVRDVKEGYSTPTINVGGKIIIDENAQNKEEENVNRLLNQAAEKLPGESTKDGYFKTKKVYKNNGGNVTN